MLRKGMLGALIWSIFFTANADQYSYVTLRQATDAMEAIGAGKNVVHTFCAPCGDKFSQPIDIKLIEIGRVWEGRSAIPYQAKGGESYWEVLINGEPIDLAYLYVRRRGKWTNLALRLGLSASGVPQHLGRHQVGH